MANDTLSLRAALAAINGARHLAAEAPTYALGLATSFTPLHLETLLHGRVQLRRPQARVSVETGIYGDLAGGLDHLADVALDACAVVVEWSDLDPRLGMREAIAGPRATVDDLCDTARGQVDRLASRVEDLAGRTPTAIVLPSLPFPPAYAARPGLLGPLEAELRALVAQWAASLVTRTTARVVDSDHLAGEASFGGRRDVPADIRSGFPYSASHAGALARVLTEVLLPDPPLKGLITDLDDTLWRGLVGEVGPDAVTWTLADGSHVHALYQQLLMALAERGVLLAVASKNDLEIAQQALRRPDLLVDLERIHPVTVSWSPKSAAIDDILKTWNIDESDVVFIDDNPVELAEATAVHPRLRTLLFTPNDPAAVGALLEEVNALFWRDVVTAEDALRVVSIRSSAQVADARAQAVDQRSFVTSLDGAMVLDLGAGWRAPRALELINKTNQFNLNGRRFDESAWRAACNRPGGMGCSVAYRDRFGPLGTVAVVGGIQKGSQLTIDTWVLSCRGFSRGIEHHVLAALWDRLALDEIRFDHVKTGRNGVVGDLLDSVTDTSDGGLPRLDHARLVASDMVGIHLVSFEPS